VEDFDKCTSPRPWSPSPSPCQPIRAPNLTPIEPKPQSNKTHQGPGLLKSPPGNGTSTAPPQHQPTSAYQRTSRTPTQPSPTKPRACASQSTTHRRGTGRI
jgi:hypothetical protein